MSPGRALALSRPSPSPGQDGLRAPGALGRAATSGAQGGLRRGAGGGHVPGSPSPACVPCDLRGALSEAAFPFPQIRK